MRRDVAACFAARDREGGWVGYYTLSSASVAVMDLPREIARKLPRYPSVPAVLLGRLAVDRNHQGVGLGGALVVDALRRCLKSQIAAYALVVEAVDGDAIGFYAHLGFTRFPESPHRLFLSMATARKVLSG
jgi:GNAT superfamily N-acetyltransferase